MPKFTLLLAAAALVAAPAALAQTTEAPASETPAVTVEPVATAPAQAPADAAASVETPAPAPAGRPGLIPASAADGCELHIWPAERMAAQTTGWLSGFGVIGAGKKALKEAHAVLKDKNNVDWQQQLPKDTELSLVFFHFATGWHPELDSVEQSHDSIVVRYKFIQPEQPSFGAARFALIPLGKLSPGTVNVKCEQLPPRDYRGLKIKEKPALERLVCDSFSFEVR